MTRSRTSARTSAWQGAGRTWLEISLAAPQVIAHRTARMWLAGGSPGARDRQEFTRMGQEKLDAVAESAVATGLKLWQLQQTAAMAACQAAWGAWLAPWTGMAQPARRRSQDPWPALLQAGMAPVHRRVTANAKRLSRAKIGG